MKSNIPTVEDLNEIQREWMAVDANGPKSEIDRVCKLMEQIPHCYVSGHDGKGVVIHGGSPCNQPMDFGFCLELCKGHRGRTDIAWNGTLGQWYSLV